MSEKDERIEAAIAEYRQKEPQVTFQEVADKHGIHRTTLSRRIQGKTTSTFQNRRNEQAALRIDQELGIIEWIHSLTKRKLPPTPGMVVKLAESVAGRALSHSWMPRFLQRHDDELVRKWLPGVDKARILAEARIRCYEIWYQRVSNRPNL